MLCKRCRPSQKEHNKIRFAIFGFFYDLIRNLQVTAKTLQGGKNLIALGSLELFNFTTLPSALTHRSLQE
jgi:hypothetical protein